MRYQLVLQFAADTLNDYDALVALERQPTAVLGDGAVDGHDMGSGEANIFVHTTDPQHAFRQVFPLLERTGHILHVTAAYRHTDGDRYHVLRPENSSRQFSVA
jgi:hypothetical protein